MHRCLFSLGHSKKAFIVIVFHMGTQSCLQLQFKALTITVTVQHFFLLITALNAFFCIVFAFSAFDTRLCFLQDPPPPADTRHTVQADRPTVARGRHRPSAGWSAAAHKQDQVSEM